MIRGTLFQRLFKGVRWAWTAESHRSTLPADLADSVMAIVSNDRHHAKQGRSTARVRFDGPNGERLSVYLKRHDRLPLLSRMTAAIVPSGKDTPATVEWAHLDRAKALGIPVPEVVAAGEWIGPWGGLRGFLMVRELEHSEELNTVIPKLADSLDVQSFNRLKRELIREMASIASRLHAANHFHKDLYLCHYFLHADPGRPANERLTLIDLHRLGEHRWMSWRWRWKDLGQLLYSSFEVEGVNDRDRLRFWHHYRKLAGLRLDRWHLRAIRAKAERYRDHNG